MDKTISQKLKELDELIAQKNFTEALRQLMQIKPENLDTFDRAFYYVVYSEAKLWLGESNVGDELDQAIQIYKSGRDNELFARAKYLHGWYLTFQGKYMEARETLMESYLNYRRCDNLRAVARVLNRLAYVHHHCGALKDAIRNLEQATEINRQIGRRHNYLIGVHNLAIAHFRVGSLRNSLAQLRAVEEETKSMIDYTQYSFYLIYGMVTALLGDIKKGLELINITQDFSQEYPRNRAIYYEYLGWIHNLDGRFEQAVKSLKSGLDIARRFSGEAYTFSQTNRLLAETYLGLNDFKEAQVTAEEALALAEEHHEQMEIAACYRVFAQVEQNRGNRKKTLDWFKKAMNIFAANHYQYELAVTRYLAANSDFCEPGERIAWLYLAYEYFKGENIQPYMEPISRQLAAISRAGAVKPAGEDKDKITFVAAEKKTKDIVALARNVAPSRMTVLLTGESGSGKDHLARYIHYHAACPGPFVIVNCAAIPGSMIEAELFGHRKGAFTGADHDRVGLFEEADGGTLFLNEIGDASADFQAKLLEVIESKNIRRLGENTSKAVDVRVIAASNQNLDKLIADGRFRPDLFHRLNEIAIHLPGLKDRPDDIPALTDYFLKQAASPGRIKSSAEIERLGKIMAHYDWPGNVRQLRTEINRLWFTSGGDLARMIELALEAGSKNEHERLKMVLRWTDWNRRETARLIGVSEGTVRNRIKKYGLIEK